MANQQRRILIVSIMASVLSGLDATVVNVALPAIVSELGGGFATQQWVSSAYLVTLGSLILVAGSLSDLFGRKRILTWGVVGFGIVSVLCSLAPNAEILIFARAAQGIFGALLVPSSLALIIATFSGSAQGKAIGTWTAWQSISFMIGPFIGGLLVDTLSWRWVFLINILPTVVILWLMRKLKADEVVKGVRVDWIGAVSCTIGLASIVYALIEQPQYGWSSPPIYAPLSFGVLILFTFILWEAREKQPMLPLSLFKIRNFIVGNLATVAIYAGLSVATFLITIFVQLVGHYPASIAGITILPVTIIMFLLSSRFGALAGRFGPRLFMSLGPIVAAIGFLLMLRVDANVSYVSQLLPGILVFGLGLSMTVAPLTTAVLADIEKRHAGIGSAVNNAVARIAGLIAIASIGLAVGETITVAGFHRGIIVMAVLLIIGGIISAIGIRNHVSKK